MTSTTPEMTTSSYRDDGKILLRNPGLYAKPRFLRQTPLISRITSRVSQNGRFKLRRHKYPEHMNVWLQLCNAHTAFVNHLHVQAAWLDTIDLSVSTSLSF